MNNLIDINKAKDVFKNGAGFLEELSKPTTKKSPPYQIRWEGAIVRLRSGKSIWPTLGAAKCALRQKIDENKLIQLAGLGLENLPHTTDPWGKKRYNAKDRDYFYNMVLDELQKQGILVFEPVYPESS